VIDFDILGGLLAVASVLLLACILVVLAITDIAGFALGAFTVGGLFVLAYRSDSKKDRRKR